MSSFFYVNVYYWELVILSWFNQLKRFFNGNMWDERGNVLKLRYLMNKDKERYIKLIIYLFLWLMFGYLDFGLRGEFWVLFKLINDSILVLCVLL